MDSSEIQYRGGKRRQPHGSTFELDHIDNGQDFAPLQPHRTIRRRPARPLFKRQEQRVEEAASLGILAPSPSAWVSSSSALPTSASGSNTEPPTSASSSDLGNWIATTTPLATNSLKNPGHSPLESLPVQLILGCLGGFIILVVTLRCVYVNRQSRALTEARLNRHSNLAMAERQSRILASANVAGGRTHLVPTNQSTLAARLNAYQQEADSRRYIYPYQQEPIGAGDGPYSSVVSFVAPSYQHDVSPPPFMVDAGKPPAYAAAIATAVEAMREAASPTDVPPRPISPATPPSAPIHTLPSENASHPTDTPEAYRERRENS